MKQSGSIDFFTMQFKSFLMISCKRLRNSDIFSSKWFICMVLVDPVPVYRNNVSITVDSLRLKSIKATNRNCIYRGDMYFPPTQVHGPCLSEAIKSAYTVPKHISTWYIQWFLHRWQILLKIVIMQYTWNEANAVLCFTKLISFLSFAH